MKKIRFPLILKDEYPARNMEELREYFDIGKIYECLCDGRLLSWLEDRQYGEAEEIKECDELDENLAERLCEIFRVEYEEQYSQNMKELQKARTDFVLLGRESTDFEAKRGGIFGWMNQMLFGTVNKPGDETVEDFFDEEDSTDEEPMLECEFEVEALPISDAKVLEKDKKSDKQKVGARHTYSVAEVKAYANQEDLLEEDLEEVFLNGDSISIRKSETVSYSNKVLYFSSNVACAGELEISRCVIVQDGEYSLVLERDGSLKIKDSLIDCRGYKGYGTFIQSKYDSRDLSIQMENCTFLACFNFIELEHAEKIMIKHCRMKNCYAGFLEVQMNAEDNTSKVDISENLIICEERKVFHRDCEGAAMFKVKSSSSDTNNFNFHDNVVYESDTFLSRDEWSVIAFAIVDSNVLNIYNCDFYKVKTRDGYNVLQNVQIHNCRFTECHNIIGDSYENRKPINIKNCVFNSCTAIGKFIHKGVDIQKCQFSRCFDKLIQAERPLHIANCEFENIKSTFEKDSRYSFDIKYHTCILLPETSNKNLIENCIFNGIYMQKIKEDIAAGYFIASDDVCDVPSYLFTTIKKCSFKNCKTDRGDNVFIKQRVKHIKIFGKEKTYEICDISDCEGYEKVSKEDDHTEDSALWETDDAGNVIGASSIVPRSMKWESGVKK